MARRLILFTASLVGLLVANGALASRVYDSQAVARAQLSQRMGLEPGGLVTRSAHYETRLLAQSARFEFEGPAGVVGVRLSRSLPWGDWTLNGIEQAR
jgi:hypothetical protein